MSHSTPLISIVIPTHNRYKLLKNAINSVVNQTYKNWELIIIDDASEDETSNIVSDYGKNKIKYYYNEISKGGSGSRNVGIAVSKGEFIAFLDDDDEWFPEKLEKQLPLFNDKKVGLVYSGVKLVFLNYNLSYETTPNKRGNAYKDVLVKNYIGGTISVILRKNILPDSKWFDENIPARQDYDLWIRVTKICKVNFVTEPLAIAYYRNKIDRISTNLDNHKVAIEMINKKYQKNISIMLSEKEKLIRTAFQYFFIGSQAIKNYNCKDARKYYWKAFKTKKNLKAIISYLLSFFGARTVIVSRYYFDRIFR